MELSLIIPVYNGEKTLGDLDKRIREVLAHKFTYEVIYVFDCGKDKSWELIKSLVEKDPDHVRGIHLKRNYGQHKAIIFGMTKASGDFIVTLDEDLQHDPGYIDQMMKAQKKFSFDVVYGKFERLEHPGPRIRTSEALRKMIHIFIPNISPDYSPYRLLKNDIAEKLSGFKNSYCFIDGFIGWTTKNTGSVPIKHFKRADGESSYSYFKLIKHAIMIIIDYSGIKTWLLGISLFLNMTALVLYSIFRANDFLSGSRIITILILPGVILLSLGLLAEVIHYGNLKLSSETVESE